MEIKRKVERGGKVGREGEAGRRRVGKEIKGRGREMDGWNRCGKFKCRRD